MKRIIDYQITSEYQNYKIENFLKEMGYTHAVLTALKKTHEGIVLNDHWAYTNEVLSTGDYLKTTIIETGSSEDIEPVMLPLNIVYEDPDIIVIDKDANVPIHPSMGNHYNTLANGLMYYYKSRGSDFTFRCINRLDRDTTGLTIVAKHALAAGILGQAVGRRQIHRSYQAICQGRTPESGTIDGPIGRKSNSTIERQIDPVNGDKAITHYRLLKYIPDKDLSLVELHLETGRTHQIRVHMKSIGHPLIGDFLYNPDYRFIDRQALHSARLSFVHPVTKEKMDFHAPLHRDMQSIL